jgi:hypothetical protein
MEITPIILASAGIQGNLVLIAESYFVVDATEYIGTKPKDGKHRLVAYCRDCFAKLAAATHRLAARAFEMLEELIMRCHRCIRRVDGALLKPHRGSKTANPSGHIGKQIHPNLGIG